MSGHKGEDAPCRAALRMLGAGEIDLVSDPYRSLSLRPRLWFASIIQIRSRVGPIEGWFLEFSLFDAI